MKSNSAHLFLPLNLPKHCNSDLRNKWSHRSLSHLKQKISVWSEQKVVSTVEGSHQRKGEPLNDLVCPGLGLWFQKGTLGAPTPAKLTPLLAYEPCPCHLYPGNLSKHVSIKPERQSTKITTNHPNTTPWAASQMYHLSVASDHSVKQLFEEVRELLQLN